MSVEKLEDLSCIERKVNLPPSNSQWTKVYASLSVKAESGVFGSETPAA